MTILRWSVGSTLSPWVVRYGGCSGMKADYLAAALPLSQHNLRSTVLDSSMETSPSRFQWVQARPRPAFCLGEWTFRALTIRLSQHTAGGKQACSFRTTGGPLQT